MEIRLFAFIGNDIDAINMFNYIVDVGVDKAKFTDYIMMNNDIPARLKELVIDIDKEKENIFAETFGLKDFELINKGWYDFKYHSFIKDKDISLDYSRVYSSDLFNLTNVSERFGFPIDYPIVKIKELQKIYINTIDQLFGDVLLFKIYRKAYDVAFANERSFIYSINTIEEALAFKQSFSSTGDIIDITGKSDIPCDYKANSYLINSKSPIIKFNHILNIVKFILI